MSHVTQENFERLINKYYQQNKDALSLSPPNFKRDGYITTATMFASRGRVEMRCGPAEYNAEVFIYTDDGKRWTLADLISNDRVRTWLEDNRPSTAGRSRLDIEVDYAFGLLSDGLRGIDRFEWLYTIDSYRQ